jgi:serine/threonine protein kinase
MEKKEMLKHSNSKVHVQHAVLEKQIMTGMRHRNVVQLCYAFQTNSKLYMVLDLCQGGTLYGHMSNPLLYSHHLLSDRYDYYIRQSNARLDEVQARFIIAQCVLALEYIHR